jgi:hypothetical protein
MHSARPIEPIRSQFAVSVFGFATIPSAARRIHAELLGDLVELDLLAEARLRRSVPALRAARRLVRERAAGLEPVARNLVGHRLQHAGVERARDAIRAVAAAIDQRLQADAGELAVLRHAGAELHQHRVPAAMHVEHFLAIQADLHRPAKNERRLRTDDLVVADVGLAAEAAAVRARDHADVRGRNSQHARKRRCT